MEMGFVEAWGFDWEEVSRIQHSTEDELELCDSAYNADEQAAQILPEQLARVELFSEL
jgi:hypothetical protein